MPSALGQEASSSSLQQRMARWWNPSINDEEAELARLNAELKEFPPFSPGRRGASAGYHSRYFDSAEQTIEIILDLRGSYSIERIALFSVSAVFQGENLEGYGFPRRLQLDVSTDPDFSSLNLSNLSAYRKPWASDGMQGKSKSQMKRSPGGGNPTRKRGNRCVPGLRIGLPRFRKLKN